MANNGKINLIPKDQWIAKMKAEGKFVDRPKTAFKDLPEETKRAWFEKKGIEYKPFGTFKDMDDDEKRAWFE